MMSEQSHLSKVICLHRDDIERREKDELESEGRTAVGLSLAFIAAPRNDNMQITKRISSVSKSLVIL